MAIEISTTGTMVAYAGGIIDADKGDLFWYGGPNGVAKGRLIITNQRTAATRSHVVRQLGAGDLLWDWSVDDPTAQTGDLLDFEFFGSWGGVAGIGGYITTQNTPTLVCNVNDNGTASVLNFPISIGEP